MSVSVTAYRLLLSAPGDIPQGDVQAIFDTIGRWNVSYGLPSGTIVVPTIWSEHSAPVYGDRPQSVLNEQLVDQADLVLALFWHRLGSPTGEAESGTIEEIERAHERGAYVAILRCDRSLPADVDVEQLQRLRDYFDRIRTNSLYLTYTTPDRLIQHVEATLNRATAAGSAQARSSADAATAGAAVWARIDRERYTEQDVKGRLKNRTRWRLVIFNKGTEPARNVTFELQLEQEDVDAGRHAPPVLSEARPLDVLAPQGEAEYTISPHMGTAEQVRCVVRWTDSGGEHEQPITLRIF